MSNQIKEDKLIGRFDARTWAQEFMDSLNFVKEVTYADAGRVPTCYMGDTSRIQALRNKYSVKDNSNR